MSDPTKCCCGATGAHDCPGFIGSGPAPTPPETAKGCEFCRDKFSGRPCPYCSPAPVRGLDFEAAQQSADATRWEPWEGSWLNAYHDHLNAQLSARLAEATEGVRKENQRHIDKATLEIGRRVEAEVAFAALETRHAALRTVVEKVRKSGKCRCKDREPCPRCDAEMALEDVLAALGGGNG